MQCSRNNPGDYPIWLFAENTSAQVSKANDHGLFANHIVTKEFVEFL